MKIIEHDFGIFPEIEPLNQRFIHGRTKQKITIDVISSVDVYRKAFIVLEQEVQRLFPALSMHDCGTNTPGLQETKGPFNAFHGVIDVVHIIEHIMIDLMCNLADLKICSGITCHHWQPLNRYDIFVESIDQKMSLFAAYFATSLVREILATQHVNVKFSILLEKIKQFQVTDETFNPSFNFNSQLAALNGFQLV